MTDPSLFRDERRRLASTLEDLEKGFLRTEDSRADGFTINVPSWIVDPDAFNRRIIEAWRCVSSFPL